MSLESQAPLAFEFRRYLGYPSCPRCGNHLALAEASEFLRSGQVRHSWECEACGEQFQTAVTVESPSTSPA